MYNEFTDGYNTLRPILDEYRKKLENDNMDGQAKIVQSSIDLLAQQNAINITAFQHIGSMSMNIDRLTDTMIHMLTVTRNILALRAGERGVRIKEDSPQKKVKKPLTFPDCTTLQKTFITTLSLSMGRDSHDELDPFDVTIPCSQDVMLPPLIQEEEAAIDQAMKNHLNKPTQVASLEQGLMLLQARMCQDIDAYDLLIKIPQIYSNPNKWDFHRIMIEDKMGGPGANLWVAHRATVSKILFDNWINTQPLQDALLKLLYMYEYAIPHEYKPKGGLRSTQITYTGFNEDWWSVGWSQLVTKNNTPREPLFIQKKKGYLRKLRKTLRREKVYNHNVAHLEAEIWNVRQDIKSFISIWSCNLLYKQMYRVNERNRYGIAALYDVLRINKHRTNDKFLLKNALDEPLCQQEDIQQALFRQVDSIFCVQYWPLADSTLRSVHLHIDNFSQQFLVEDITEEEVRFAVKHLNKGTPSFFLCCGAKKA